jgi:hypothetical protein
MGMTLQAPKTEKPQQREAFEVYYLMGDVRSVRKVAKEVGKSSTTIQNWSNQFNWQERVEIRDTTVKKAFEKQVEKVDDTIVNIKAQYHKVLKFVIAEALKDIQSGKLKITSVRDLIGVIELDLTLLGEEDRRTQGQMDDLNKAITSSLQMFGQKGLEYDGKDRIEE